MVSMFSNSRWLAMTGCAIYHFFQINIKIKINKIINNAFVVIWVFKYGFWYFITGKQTNIQYSLTLWMQMCEMLNCKLGILFFTYLNLNLYLETSLSQEIEECLNADKRDLRKMLSNLRQVRRISRVIQCTEVLYVWAL